MSDELDSHSDILRRSADWYETKIRDVIETPENKGKMVWIDIISGDYEVAEMASLHEGTTRLRKRNPNAQVSGRIIGHDYSEMKDRPINPFRFAWADAWLLLSIVYAGKNAMLTNIIRMGDMLNHAIFTDEEMIDGLSRLIVAGLISEENETFTADDRAKQVYHQVIQTHPGPLSQIMPYSEWLAKFPAVLETDFWAVRAKYTAFVVGEKETAYNAYSEWHTQISGPLIQTATEKYKEQSKKNQT